MPTHTLNSTYSFIDDPKIKENVLDSIEHAIYLLMLPEKYSIAGEGRSHLYLDSIIHLGAAIEALLHYGVSKCFDHVRDPEWSYSELFEVHKYNQFTRKIIARKVRKKIKASEAKQFNDLIKISKENNLLGKKLSEECHKVRALRNFQHATITSRRPKNYTKKEVTQAFDTLVSVTARISKKTS